MSEWDPWKRYERERERRMWDPLASYEYERDRYHSDPWFRFERNRERYYTDPFYRFEKEMDRLSWDPWYRELKRREWKYDEGNMFRDRVISNLEYDGGKSTSGISRGSSSFDEVWELSKVRAWGELIEGPKWLNYLKIALGFGFVGWLFYMAYILMTFRLPFP